MKSFPEGKEPIHYSRNLDNWKEELKELVIKVALGQDDQVRYCPTLFLTNKKGKLRYVHLGEGAFD